MDDTWIEVKLTSKRFTSEELIGLLYDFPFNSFQENEHYLLAFITEPEWSSIQDEIKATVRSLDIEYTTQTFDPDDWNAEWEKNFPPVVIPGVASITALFHDRNDSEPVNIVIAPKMAFGTGHHETTSGMLKAMSKLVFKNKTVLDFGSGTGILAIYASLQGATSVTAIDLSLIHI